MTDSTSKMTDSEREAALDRALDSGMTELPPNQVKGLLGEKGPDLRKVDEFTPDLNSGISQEVDLPVVWVGILLAYLLLFPLAYVLLWRSKHISRRGKIISSVVGAVGVVAVLIWLPVS